MSTVLHFTMEELTFSQVALRKGLPNAPNEQQLANLVRLRDELLEPGRLLIPVPWHVDSGYRSPLVNAAVGGASDSAHMEGRAADVIPKGVSLREAFDVLRSAPRLAYDQIILECDAWIHLAIARLGQTPRRQALLAKGYAGHWTYSLA